MEVETVGDGEPEYCVLALIHGDETAGRKAVERVLEKIDGEELELLEPFKVVYASTDAAEMGEKFIDQDLNRSFPGDPDSNVYEERLAAEIADELEGMKVLDLHTTASENKFGVVLDQSDESIEEISKTGVEKAVDFEDSSARIPGCTRVAVEASRKGRPVSHLERMVVSYLSCSEVVKGECRRQRPDIFEIYDEVEGSRWKFDAENFTLVEKGEVFAFHGKETLKADEDFYPVLMSDDGYENIIGFKARKV
jgi:succinylglutamate desuccinylase